MIQNRKSTTADKNGQFDHDAAVRMIGRIISFLRNLMTETLAKRLVGIVLIAAGVPNGRVTELTGLCGRSVRELRKKIKDGNADEGLFHAGGGGGKGKLKDLEELIIEKIETDNYHTQQEIADMVYDEYGIRVHRTVAGKLLKKRHQKVKERFFTGKSGLSKAVPVLPYGFKTAHGQGKERGNFPSVCGWPHFVAGCGFPGYIYGIVRRFVKTFSGRKRYNVPGALDFMTKKVTTITNDSYITACEVCELFGKIAKAYAGRTVFAVLDNARYQKCAVTGELAGQPGINPVFIPPYSPDINLIERFREFVKGKLRSRYYCRFGLFREQIDSIINSADNLNKETVDRLIGEKVQLFDDLIAVNENSFKANREAA